MKRNAIMLALGACAACFAPGAQAQGFPAKPVTIVLPYPPGGAIDFLARAVGERLSTTLGQQVLVESRPGAYERIASEFVLRQPADGYTVLMVAVPHATNPALFPALPYDTLKEFAPLSHLVNIPPVLSVNPESGPKSFREFVALARAKPGEATFGSAGNATSTHLTVELLGTIAGVQFTHIPFKGDAPAITEVLGGRVQATSNTVPAVLAHIKGGRLRGIGIASRERLPALPDVPTFVEQGYPDAVITTWFGLVTRAGVPKEATARLNADIHAALGTPALRERLVAAGMTPVGGTPEQFGAHIRTEMDRWAQLVKARGIRID